jgi:chromosome segregation ATPase
MTTEQRLSNVEQSIVLLTELCRGLRETDDKIIGLLETQQQQIKEHRAEIVEHRAELVEHRAEVAEYRRDARQYQRLWVHLARKHGWVEDEDWPPPGDE